MGGLDDYLKDLKEDMEHAIEDEDCSINVTSKDVEKITRLIHRNKRKQSQLERQRDIRDLFERKFINYRNKLVSLYKNTTDESLKSEIRHFLEVEQGDVVFHDVNKGSEES